MKALRVSLHIVKYLLIVWLLLVLIWWVFNCIDESPTPEAQRWNTPFIHSVPDEQNAWLYLVGMGAAEGESPIAFGRRRVDMYEARTNQRPRPLISEEEKALFEDPVPFKGINAQVDGVEALCTFQETDCIDWAKQHSDLLAHLEKENTLRLQRYATLLGLSQMDELYTPSVEEPVPKFDDDALYRNLIARDVNTNPDLVQPIAKLVRGTLFWQHVDEQAHSPILKRVSERMLEKYWRLLDVIIDRCSMDQLHAIQTDIDIILRAPTARQRDMQSILRYEMLTFKHEMQHVFVGPLDFIKNCRNGVYGDSCAQDWFIAETYLPQATLNLHAQYSEAAADLYATDARDYQVARSAFITLIEMYNPLANADSSLRMLVYNATGKVLVALSVPDQNWIEHQHDSEALRRMFVLKIKAKQQGITTEQMPGFLMEQPEALRNPYTTKPFSWDVAQREIWFTPFAKDWKSARLNVTYPVSITP